MNSSSIAKLVRAASLMIVIGFAASGCYLLQSAHGHLQLMSKREPIDVIIARPDTPVALRSQLQAVASIREFATHELALPNNGSYRSYADLGRPYAVWNVVAAPEFSVEPFEWCYPIVGCVAYRGFFAEPRAQAFAARQRALGREASVSGAAAYSTLGHFDDPILNTMIDWDDVELASIVFHELTHQLLYVPNDASFNEALASTVEEEGVRRWLLRQSRGSDLAQHEAEQARYQQVIDLLIKTREQLKQLYASGLPAESMRAAKHQAFAAMRESFAALKESWGGHAPLESWFLHEIDNAQLASVSTYYECVPGFRRELQAVHGELPAFYRRVRELAKLSPIARDQIVCGTLLRMGEPKLNQAQGS